VKVYRFKGEAFIAGVKDHDLDGVNVRVYDPEKTLAGCFKFRNQLGIEIVLEALKLTGSRTNLILGSF
jgi:hypothetical protein